MLIGFLKIIIVFIVTFWYSKTIYNIQVCLMNFINSNQSNELASHVLSFLDSKEIANCRFLNKRFNELGSSKALYTNDIYRVKYSYDQYLNKQNEYDALNKRLKAISSQLKSIEGKGFGYFVYKINYTSGILSIITNLLSKLFPYIKNEVNVQNKLKREMDVLVCNKLNLHLKKNILLGDYRKQKDDCIELKQKNEEVDKMTALFGGRSSFETLPVFEVPPNICYLNKGLGFRIYICSRKNDSAHYEGE